MEFKGIKWLGRFWNLFDISWYCFNKLEGRLTPNKIVSSYYQYYDYDRPSSTKYSSIIILFLFHLSYYSFFNIDFVLKIFWTWLSKIPFNSSTSGWNFLPFLLIFRRQSCPHKILSRNLKTFSDDIRHVLALHQRFLIFPDLGIEVLLGSKFKTRLMIENAIHVLETLFNFKVFVNTFWTNYVHNCKILIWHQENGDRYKL